VLDLPADPPAPERQHSMCFKGPQAPRLWETDHAMVGSLASVCQMPGWQKDLLFAFIESANRIRCGLEQWAEVLRWQPANRPIRTVSRRTR
jgi:hypothetical protein